MTWGEFKEKVEKLGVVDADVIAFIDTEGYAGLQAACDCDCSISGEGALGYPEDTGEPHDRLVAGRVRDGKVAIYPFEDDAPYQPCPQGGTWVGEWPSRIELPFPVRIYGEKSVRPLK